MGVDGIYIGAVGSEASVREWAVNEVGGNGYRVMNGGGRLILPGIHDSHAHPLQGGISLSHCILEDATTEEEVISMIRTCAINDKREWLQGRGWSLPLFPDANPSKTLLDNIAEIGNRSAVMVAQDGHSSWVNSVALARANITKYTPDPENGRIERDSNGNPTGTLREDAMLLIEAILPPVTDEEYKQAARKGLALFASLGITSVQDADCKESYIKAYNALDQAKELKSHIRCSMLMSPMLLRQQKQYESEHLVVNTAKIYIDGVIEARTAALLEPYIGFNDSGTPNYTPDEVNALTSALDKAGVQCHYHAIGDRAIRMAIDALEGAQRNNGIRDSRHHISHLELIEPEDHHRFRKLGIVANFQPLWAINDTYIYDLTIPLLGPTRSRLVTLLLCCVAYWSLTCLCAFSRRNSWLYPMRSIVDTGAYVVAGSDWFVTSADPLEAIQVGLTRRALNAGPGPAWLPEETLDITTMLAMYTTSGAYGAFAEHSYGQLARGYFADFVMYDRNIFDGAIYEVSQASVLCTIFEGSVIFGACSAT
jgi:predicted amidohydrolase YtcJ